MTVAPSTTTGTGFGREGGCVLMTGKHSGQAAIRNNREVKPEGQEPLPAAELTMAARERALSAQPPLS